jgi:hypothetical protein
VNYILPLSSHDHTPTTFTFSTSAPELSIVFIVCFKPCAMSRHFGSNFHFPHFSSSILSSIYYCYLLIFVPAFRPSFLPTAIVFFCLPPIFESNFSNFVFPRPVTYFTCFPTQHYIFAYLAVYFIKCRLRESPLKETIM